MFPYMYFARTYFFAGYFGSGVLTADLTAVTAEALLTGTTASALMTAETAEALLTATGV